MSRIGRLSATISVPSQGDLPLGTLDRIGTAVRTQVPVALGRRFPVDPSDPVADRPVVLIRRLTVPAAVPASASAGEIAERLADRLARAIRTAPDEGQVRYPSRAAHIGAFVAALAGGTGDSWVFGAFAGVRLLAPLTALRTLAERYEVPVVAVLAALYRSGDLVTVLSRAAPVEVTRTWAACLAVPHPRVSRAQAQQHLGPDPVDDAPLAGRPRAEARSIVLAAATFARGQPAAVAVATGRALAGEHSATPPRSADGAEPVAAPPDVAPADGDGRDRGPVAFAAAGAPAFLLLPSFAKVGLGELAPAQRAQILAVATRTSPDDPAVVLAAGPADRPPVPIGPAMQRALIDDDRLGLDALSAIAVHGLVVVADARSGIWLAILEPGEAVEDALIPALAELPCAAAEPDDALLGRMLADLRFLLPEAGPAAGGPVADAATRSVAVAARAGLGHFARRLGGFGASSLPYLSDRFLTPGGVVADLDDSIWVRLPAPPLLVVLALAGLDRTTVEVPWLEPVVTITHEDAG